MVSRFSRKNGDNPTQKVYNKHYTFFSVYGTMGSEWQLCRFGGSDSI